MRIQWDPERTVDGEPLHHRSLQVGLSGPSLVRYTAEWISGIDDITATLDRRRRGLDPLPDERPYPLPATIATRIAATG